MWGIAVAAFVAIFAFNIPFPYIVLAAAAVGYAGGRWAPEYFKAGAAMARAKILRPRTH